MSDEPRNQNDDDLDFDPGFDEDIDVESVDEFPSEDWDEEFDEGQNAEESPAPVKRRGGMPGGKLTYLVLLILVVGIGGFMVLGNKPQTTQSTLPDSALPSMPEAGMQVDELANSSDLPPMPAPMGAGEEDAAPVQDVIAIEDPVLEVPKIPVTPPDRKLSQVDMSEPVADTTVKTSEETQATSNIDVTALLAEKETEMEARVAALDKEWQSKFSQMKSELVQKVEAAENKLKNLQGKNDSSEGSVKTLQSENDALKMEIETLKAEKQQVESELVASKAEASKIAAKPAPVVTGSADLWVLRSAQPGKALISQKGSEVMQSVKVGDTVPGLGKIISIKSEAGQWVVAGETGKLSR